VRNSGVLAMGTCGGQLWRAAVQGSLHVAVQYASWLLPHMHTCLFLHCLTAADRIEPRQTPNPRVICARRRFAITMYWLAAGCLERDVARLFGVSVPAVSTILHRVIPAMHSVYVPRFITFPAGDELRRVFADFQYKGLPLCAGALDGSFINILRPPGVHSYRYYCYKHYDAIILLAACDARGVFTFATAGQPGCVGDAATFHASSLKRSLLLERILPTSAGTVHGEPLVRPFLVADAAFPLLPFLLKCYDGIFAADTPEAEFNAALTRCRQVIEAAFGRLKKRFRVLTAGTMSDPEFLSDITVVCCALHNVCTLRGCELDEPALPEVELPVPNNEPDPPSAIEARNTVAAYVYQQNRTL
jgi:hypothetical protein